MLNDNDSSFLLPRAVELINTQMVNEAEYHMARMEALKETGLAGRVAVLEKAIWSMCDQINKGDYTDELGHNFKTNITYHEALALLPEEAPNDSDTTP